MEDSREYDHQEPEPPNENTIPERYAHYPPLSYYSPNGRMFDPAGSRLP